MSPFELRLRTRLVFGCGALEQVGTLAQELDFRRTLLVADQGLVDAGHVAQTSKLLAAAAIEVVPFHNFNSDPDSNMIEAGRAFAASAGVDSIIGLGGGSSMDC